MTTIEYRLPPDYRAASLRADALAGLTATPKSLPPKWFYDAQGSALFEKITELPEYYPTRAERSILRAAAARDRRALAGAGAGRARLRLVGEDPAAAVGAARRRARSRPTCRSTSASRRSSAAEALAVEYPGLAVHAVVSDFEQYLGLEPSPGAAPAPAGDRERAATPRPGRGWWPSSARRSATWCRPSARPSCGGSAQPPAGRLLPARHRPRQGRRRCWWPPTTTRPG